jgi:hypothetical protein
MYYGFGETAATNRVKITRAPTAAELSRWQSKVISQFDQLSDRVFSLGLLSDGLIRRSKFATENNITVSLPTAASAEQRYLTLRSDVETMRTALDAVRRGEYGVRARSDGDFDILQPSGQLGLIWIPIALGVVVISGCAAWVYNHFQEVNAVIAQYQQMRNVTESVFCKDHSSPLCKKWEAVKKEENIVEQETFADRVGGAVQTGLQWGVPIVLALLALKFLRST